MITRAYEDVLNRAPDQDGLRVYRRHVVDDGWTEQQVRQSLRNSSEYRQQSTMTYGKAQEIVRQAYQNVLHREPDAGANGYVNNVMSKRMTQADVENELRKSSEYRQALAGPRAERPSIVRRSAPRLIAVELIADVRNWHRERL